MKPMKINLLKKFFCYTLLLHNLLLKYEYNIMKYVCSIECNFMNIKILNHVLFKNKSFLNK